MILQFRRRTQDKIAIEVMNNEGQLLRTRLINRYSQPDVSWLMKVSGWELTETHHNIREFIEEANLDVEEPDEFAAWQIEENDENLKELGIDEADPIPPLRIYVRELTQLKERSFQFIDNDPCDGLKRAFFETPSTLKEPVIEWNDYDRLTCLDIDYHNEYARSLEELSNIVSRISPQPFAWHPSHGNDYGYGAKLYYVSHPGFTAKELASVAGLNWVECDPCATFDLVKNTRHPGFPRSRDGRPAPINGEDGIAFLYGSGDVSSIRRLLLAEMEPEDIENYLTSKGWNIGQTLSHNHCPLNPTDDFKQSVFIGDRGIYCHKCAAGGIGGKNPGFASYGQLIGGKDSRLATMVRNFTHLEHARIVLENLYPSIPQQMLDNIYKVMLKIVHQQDDPRIYMAMTAGQGFVRNNGLWCTSDGRTPITDSVSRFVQSLPATLVPKEDGFATNIPKFTSLVNGGDVSDIGYPDINFIRGCRIYGIHNRYSDGEIIKAVPRKEFVNCPPRYLTKSTRMPIEDAWNLLEEEFPGVNRTYVKLLICAKGASEGRLAQCPFLMITGVSKAGKSSTAHIAAGICGDKGDEPVFHPDPIRFRASLMDAARQSSFVCVNEVFKYANLHKLSPTQALDPMLSLTEDSRSHVLYVGSVPFGRLPVFVLTDIACPPEILQDYQLARRFTFFRLDSSVEWEPTLISRNIRLHQFRCISLEHNRAADTILSDIIDEFFTEPIPLSEMTKRLGISGNEVTIGDIRDASLSSDIDEHKKTFLDLVNSIKPTSTDTLLTELDFESDARAEIKEQLIKFYNLVINAEAITGSDSTRYPSKRGWKKIERFGKSPILDAWNELCDGMDGDKWTRSRKVLAEDFGVLLKLPFAVVCQITPYRDGKILYVRFRSNDNKKYPSWVNGKPMSY